MGLLRFTALALLLVFLVQTEIASSQLVALLRGNNGVITIDRNPNLKCKKQQMECIDCNNGRICRPESTGLVQIATVKCLPDSDAPYCNPSTGLCTKDPPENCGTNKFICPPDDGVYPDASNCSRYHLCAHGVATSNNCPRNNVYDHSTGQCKYKRRASDCVTINCANKNGQAVVYPADDRIWGRCVDNQALILGKCKSYERYDVTKQTCVRVCRAVGNQPTESNDCQKYIYCAEVAPSRYESVEQSCACNEGFDPNENKCTTKAECLKSLPSICGITASSTEASTAASDTTTETPTDDPFSLTVSGRIINNSGHENVGNGVSNGNDNVSGNLVNGNNNENVNNAENLSGNKETGPTYAPYD